MGKVEELLKCRLRTDTPTAIYVLALSFLSMAVFIVPPLFSTLFLWGTIFLYLAILEKGTFKYDWFNESNKKERRRLLVSSAILFLLLAINVIPIGAFAVSGSKHLYVALSSAYFFAFFKYFIPEYLKLSSKKEKFLLYLKYLLGFYWGRDFLFYLFVVVVSVVGHHLYPPLLSLISPLILSYIILCESRGGRG